MNEYFAMRIHEGGLPYWKVIDKYPKRKEKIDKFLTEKYHYEIPTERP